ncbi:MAG: serine/threonine-protein kinase [Myxococcota bacterium]
MPPRTATVPHLPPCGSQLCAGDQVGRYRVLFELGRGAMGAVFRAFDPLLGRDVALKALHVEDARSRQRFVREAQAMARLSHPNVVQVFDVVRVRRGGGRSDRCLIAMELVEGQTLEAWLEASRSWDAIVAVFDGAARGLAAAHRAGLVHRDFKPANLIVGRKGRVRVTDFGLTLTAEERAPTQDEDGDASGCESPDGTGVGGTVGTPAYMAPEQHLGHGVGPAADQFSFCVAMFEAVYGVRPFTGRSCTELAEQKLAGRWCRAPKGRTVPRWLGRVIRRGLSPEPQCRFASMDALLTALRRGRERRRWSAPAAMAGALTVLVALGVAGAPDQSAAAVAASASALASAGSSLLDSSAVPSISSASRRR